MEVEKVMKKYKEEFNSATDKTQEHVTYLEYAHDDLVQYGRCLCVRVEDITVATDEAADKVLEKVKNIKKKKRVQVYWVMLLIGHIISGGISNFLKPTIPATASFYISTASSIEHHSVKTGIN